MTESTNATSVNGVAAAGVAVSIPIHSAHAQTAKLAPAQARTLEDWSYALAVNAATWGGPVVIMYALRNNDAVGPKVKAAPNNLWRMENITAPSIAEEEGYVLPNDSVLYGFGFLDRRQEPVIVSLPATSSEAITLT
jgi:DNA sulfur modification protein DndE